MKQYLGTWLQNILKNKNRPLQNLTGTAVSIINILFYKSDVNTHKKNNFTFLLRHFKSINSSNRIFVEKVSIALLSVNQVKPLNGHLQMLSVTKLLYNHRCSSVCQLLLGGDAICIAANWDRGLISFVQIPLF